MQTFSSTASFTIVSFSVEITVHYYFILIWLRTQQLGTDYVFDISVCIIGTAQ